VQTSQMLLVVVKKSWNVHELSRIRHFPKFIRLTTALRYAWSVWMVTGPGVAPYDNELHRSEDMQRKLEAKINGMCDLLHQRLGQVKEDLEKVQAETARLGAAVGHGAMSNTSVKEQLDNFHELIDLVSRKQKEVQSSIKAQCGVLDEKVDDGLSELRARAEAAEGRLLLVESRLREQHEGSGKLEAFAKEQREAIRTALESAESMQDGRMAHYEEALTQMRADIADAARSRQEILECARAEQDQTLAKVQSSYDSIALRLVQQLLSHDKDLRQLADQCRDLSKAIDIKVGEVRAATKEDISAHALSAFQGEVKLLAKMAQISQQSMQPPQAQRQPPTYPEGYVWPPPMPPAPCGFLPGSVPMHGAK